LLRLGGFKTLISYNYFSEDEFWTIFDRTRYFEAKRRLDPNNRLRTLYEKTKRG
jgi:hypothetical protein